jgi:tRNA U34 5-carboxymethylaminomethyl modifying GTPase MnmE/TrmE
MVDPFRLAFDVWAMARVPLARHLPEADVEATDEILADRSGAATPRIMVFGTYNAGKSTLINALVGEEVARVADHPETAIVTSYPWRGFVLDDTPGIDAPIDHEQVTRLHLDASDAVLFVLSTDGTLEEQRTFDEIIGIIRAQKPIRIILNNKSGFRAESPEFLGLRDRLAGNLRRAAEAAGIADIEARAPIRLINAASGLRARRDGKSALLANSGLLELEADVAELCINTGKAQMARTVCRRISKQIDLVLAGLPEDDEMEAFRNASEVVSLLVV